MVLLHIISLTDEVMQETVLIVSVLAGDVKLAHMVDNPF